MAKVKCSACFNWVKEAKECSKCGSPLEMVKKAQQFGMLKSTEFWCPLCNHEVFLNNKFCDCGWEIKKLAAMAKHCPGWLWERHLARINEYRKLRDDGYIKTGYEYFKIKVGKTELSKLFVNKVEHSYTKAEVDTKRLYGIANNTFPCEWK